MGGNIKGNKIVWLFCKSSNQSLPEYEVTSVPCEIKYTINSDCARQSKQGGDDSNP